MFSTDWIVMGSFTRFVPMLRASSSQASSCGTCATPLKTVFVFLLEKKVLTYLFLLLSVLSRIRLVAVSLVVFPSTTAPLTTPPTLVMRPFLTTMMWWRSILVFNIMVSFGLDWMTLVGWIIDCAFTAAFNPDYDNLLMATKEATNRGLQVYPFPSKE